MIEATATMAMIPMTTPKTVNSDRVLCWRSESNARRVLSPISRCMVETSLELDQQALNRRLEEWTLYRSG
jgi:hypothetical protein